MELSLCTIHPRHKTGGLLSELLAHLAGSFASVDLAAPGSGLLPAGLDEFLEALEITLHPMLDGAGCSFPSSRRNPRGE
jgi:hypothetical protein